MREFFILLSPVYWSLRNDLARFNRDFYRKALLYIAGGGIFIALITKLLTAGLVKLQSLPSDIFTILLIKGYALIFIILFFLQVLNGFIISLNTFYQTRELEMLLTSPVNRSALFFSKLFESHLKASWMLVIFGVSLLLSPGMIFNASILYYAYAFCLFVIFSSIPVNIGIVLGFLFARFFQARKIKKFVLSGGIILFALLVALFRLFRPERFVNPEMFANLTLFVSEIKSPAFILLPNRWLSESLFNFLNGHYGDTVIFISVLCLTSYLTGLLALIIFQKYHYRGWALMQEGTVKERGRISSFSRVSHLLSWLTSPLNSASTILARKDMLYQLRDVKNVNQFILLLSLIVVYLFSISALPLNWEGIYGVKLKYSISFFNLGLILIIISAVCSRLIYSSVMAEGSTLWILKASPLTPGRFVWTKYLFFAFPILFLTSVLLLFSSFFIHVEKALLLMIFMTALPTVLSLAAISIVFSVSDLVRKIRDGEKDQARSGNTMYMITSVVFILLMLVLDIIPTFFYFLKESRTVQFSEKTWLIVGAVMLLSIIFNILAIMISIGKSIRIFSRLELL